MARKAFSGDLVRQLPKGRMEPYRLWFEYLKQALKVMPQKVDRDFYAQWGEVETADFDEWWQDSWRKLFAVPSSISVISTEQDFRGCVEDPDCVIIRVFRNGTTTQKLSDIKGLLEKRFGKSGSRSQAVPSFSITAKRSVHYPALRHKLRFMQLVEEHVTIEVATRRYVEWAETWNAKLAPKSRRRTTVPGTLARFAKELDAYEADLQKRSRAKKTEAFFNAQKDVQRFLKSGQKILSNVASGIFPGSS